MNLLKAVVTLRIDGQYDAHPERQRREHLHGRPARRPVHRPVARRLGGAFKDGDRIEFVQDAVVLENLISKYLFNSAAKEPASRARRAQRRRPRSERIDMRASRRRIALLAVAARGCSPAAAGVAGTDRRRRRQPAVAAPGPGPQELMQKVSQDLLRELDANRAAYAKDPSQAARARRQVPAAALRRRLRGAARARQALAHGDARRSASASSMRSTSR